MNGDRHLARYTFSPVVLRTGRHLVDAGLIDGDADQTADRIGDSIAIPLGLVALIDPNDPEDPWRGSPCDAKN